MVQPEALEDAFLAILQEDNNREKIEQRIQDFKPCDWQKLYALAIAHGLFPIFYSRLLGLNLSNIPAEFISRLKNLYILNLKRNIILEQELKRILAYFSESDIPVIPLKGPALARYIYGDLALRQASCDLDLLIRYENIKEVENVFQDLGYSLVIDSDKSISEKLGYAPVVNLKKYVDRVGVINIDLHRDMRRFFAKDLYPEIWQNIKFINIDGHRIPVPFDEDLIIYLSLVSIFFQCVELKYVYDIHSLIALSAENLNWQSLISKAKKSGVACQLYFVLKLSKGLFHATIPAEFLIAIRPNLLKENSLALWINRQNLFNSQEKMASSYIWRYFICGYISSRNIFDYFKKLSQWLLLPTEGAAKTYSSKEFKRLRYYLAMKRLLKPLSPKYLLRAVLGIRLQIME